MSLKIFFFLIVICPLLCTGCGYRFDNQDLTQMYPSISVPYIEGDQNGALTAEVVKELMTTMPFVYRKEEGDLNLKISLVDLRDKNIGFHYDRNSKGKTLRSLVPTETRNSAVVEVRLIEVASGQTLLGPVLLSSSIDYDHEYVSSPQGINVFSLGQLTDNYEAQDASMRPLNKVLARKIVDYIQSNAPSMDCKDE